MSIWWLSARPDHRICADIQHKCQHIYIGEGGCIIFQYLSLTSPAESLNINLHEQHVFYFMNTENSVKKTGGVRTASVIWLPIELVSSPWKLQQCNQVKIPRWSSKDDPCHLPETSWHLRFQMLNLTVNLCCENATTEQGNLQWPVRTILSRSSSVLMLVDSMHHLSSWILT